MPVLVIKCNNAKRDQLAARYSQFGGLVLEAIEEDRAAEIVLNADSAKDLKNFLNRYLRRNKKDANV